MYTQCFQNLMQNMLKKILKNQKMQSIVVFLTTFLLGTNGGTHSNWCLWIGQFYILICSTVQV